MELTGRGGSRGLGRLGHGRGGIAGLGGLGGGGTLSRLVLLVAVEGGLELGLEVVESVQSWRVVRRTTRCR